MLIAIALIFGVLCVVAGVVITVLVISSAIREAIARGLNL